MHIRGLGINLCACLISAIDFGEWPVNFTISRGDAPPSPVGKRFIVLESEVCWLVSSFICLPFGCLVSRLFDNFLTLYQLLRLHSVEPVLVCERRTGCHIKRPWHVVE